MLYVESHWLLTDISNGLVMVIHNYHWLNSASRVLKLTCSAPPFKWESVNNIHCLTLNFDLRSRSTTPG